jgi:hypothetical protein
MEEAGLETEMAQHLLAAADRVQLERLRRIAERRLVEAVDCDTVAFTLALADRNHAHELKRVRPRRARAGARADQRASGGRLVARRCCPKEVPDGPSWALPPPPSQVCLDFVARNLAAVLKTEGYAHMVAACPGLQGEILATVAAQGPQALPPQPAAPAPHPDAPRAPHPHARGSAPAGLAALASGLVQGYAGFSSRSREAVLEEEGRRVRPRREG